MLLDSSLFHCVCVLYFDGKQTIPEGYQISEDRRQVLVDCAHFMAAFLHWDLTVLEKGSVVVA